MQVLQIDLKKEPEIADLIQTMQVGDRLDLHASIKAMDDQTLTVTIDGAKEGEEPEDDPDAPGGNEGSAGADEDQPGKSMDGAQGGSTPDPAGLLGGEQAAT